VAYLPYVGAVRPVSRTRHLCARQHPDLLSQIAAIAPRHADDAGTSRP